MPSLTALLAFAALSIGLSATPGPNMFYLASRSLTQGRRAGLVSLLGCELGMLIIMLGAAAGVTAALLAVPMAYDALRLGGAAYLGWLAWQTLRPGGASVFAPRPMAPEPPRKLVMVGLATALLNPKVALFYVAVLPPFIDPALGDVFLQSIILGGVQVVISILFGVALVLGAGGVSGFLSTRPGWLAAQRYVLGGALALLATKLATDSRP